MGMLVDGQWRDEDPVNEIGKAGNFQRVDSIFRDRITADGSSGFPAEAGRYHLYVAYTCPWAHRTQIFLALKKLPASSASPSLSRACANKAGRSRTIRRFPIARPTVSTASATCTRRIQRAIRITPAR